MAELLYHRVHIESYSEKETVPVQFVGVYTLRWHEHPDQPTEAFYEAREEQKRVEKLEEEHRLLIAHLKIVINASSGNRVKSMTTAGQYLGSIGVKAHE